MRGFTLLEMLVVLVLLGMAAGIVVPALSRTAERVSEATDRDAVVRALARLPSIARESGERLEFPAGGPIRVAGTQWPQGWRVTALDDLVVYESGWCSGGQIEITGPTGPRVLSIGSLGCRAVE